MLAYHKNKLIVLYIYTHTHTHK